MLNRAASASGQIAFGSTESAMMETEFDGLARRMGEIERIVESAHVSLSKFLCVATGSSYGLEARTASVAPEDAPGIPGLNQKLDRLNAWATEITSLAAELRKIA